MRNRWIGLIVFTAALLVFSSVTFAQTYGTADGGAPGSWPPDQLPKELSAPRPYNPHDLSGVWASPNENLDAHWLGEHGGQMGTNGPDFWVIRPPLTEWGQDQL